MKLEAKARLQAAFNASQAVTMINTICKELSAAGMPVYVKESPKHIPHQRLVEALYWSEMTLRQGQIAALEFFKAKGFTEEKHYTPPGTVTLFKKIPKGGAVTSDLSVNVFLYKAKYFESICAVDIKIYSDELKSQT